MRVAMMCAEKDPLDCHRWILVSPRLRERGIEVLHILSDGFLESQEQVERRLAQLFDLTERRLNVEGSYFDLGNGLVADKISTPYPDPLPDRGGEGLDVTHRPPATHGRRASRRECHKTAVDVNRRQQRKQREREREEVEEE
jgi:hypothetical protein